PARWRRDRIPFPWERRRACPRESATRRPRPSIQALVFVVAGGLAGLAPHQVRVDHRIEIAFEHAVDVAEGELAAEILHEPIRRQDVVADLAAEVDFELAVLGLAGLFAFLLE